MKIFFAQDTLSKFMGKETDGGALSSASKTPHSVSDYGSAYRKLSNIQVIYENDHILLLDKPAGVLSQKADKLDLSLNEWLIGYLLEKGGLSAEDLTFFRPSVCNRLDRNTSGIVLCAKTLKGAQPSGRAVKGKNPS